MNKIQAQIKRYGLSQDELPKPVINKIREYESLLDDIKMATADVEGETDDEARKEMRAKVLEGNQIAEEMQSEIILLIQTFARKSQQAEQEATRRKAEQAAAARREAQVAARREAQVAARREAQVAARREAQVAARREAAQTNEGGTNNTPPLSSVRQKPLNGTTSSENSNNPAAVSDDAVKPKKSNKTLAWIIGGAVLVLTLGAVNTLTKK